jgi:hypothetical protein
VVILHARYGLDLPAPCLFPVPEGRDEIIPTLPSRGGVVRELTKEDFSRCGSIYLRKAAEFDTLVSLPEGQSAATVLIAAMESIEGDYETLKGLLPKQESEQGQPIVTFLCTPWPLRVKEIQVVNLRAGVSQA